MIYAYDHRGRMVTKTLRFSAPLRLIKNITYLWDDWNIIREVVREGDSVAVTDNIWGLDLDGTLQGAGGVGGLLAVVRDDGVFLPAYDANGNVSEYVSTNGEIVAHYDYSPFGEPLIASGPLASTFTHQFSTKPYCSVTGFSEYQMRKYSPEIGRWISRDPINENGGANLVLFLFNLPIFPALDYLGTDPCKIGGSCSVHGRGDEGQFDSIACSCSKNMLPVTSGKELLEHLKTLTKQSDDCCISHYTIAGHGWRNHEESKERSLGPGIPGGGDNNGFYDDTENKDENARSIDDLKKAIEAGDVKFCKSCAIQIYACRVSASFSHKLAVITGCSVVAASASCSEADGKWRSGPESSAEKQKGRYFGFYRCLPSGDVHIIGPSYEPFIQ